MKQKCTKPTHILHTCHTCLVRVSGVFTARLCCVHTQTCMGDAFTCKLHVWIADSIHFPSVNQLITVSTVTASDCRPLIHTFSPSIAWFTLPHNKPHNDNELMYSRTWLWLHYTCNYITDHQSICSVDASVLQYKMVPIDITFSTYTVCGKIPQAFPSIIAFWESLGTNLVTSVFPCAHTHTTTCSDISTCGLWKLHVHKNVQSHSN